MWSLLIPIAVVAGTVTTISGMGGGLLLLLVVTLISGAKQALAATALALLFGNLHRVWMYRRELGARVTVPLLLGLAPGSFVGALAAAWIPEQAVHVVMVGVVALSLARAWAGWTWRLPASALTGSGAIIGVLAGAAGGAGFMVGPLVLAAGLAGRGYLATVATAAVAMHVARLIGYGAGGLVTAEVVAQAAVLAPAVLVGNLVGNHVRDRIPAAYQRLVEHGTPAVCVALALAGLG